MKLNFFDKYFGSGFYTGYIPIASGTFGSLAALLIYFIPGFEKLYIIIPFIVSFFIYGTFVGTKFEEIYGKDPSEWRLLDIVKPFPARRLEKIKGGFGIMIDDVVSAIYTLMIMHLIVYFFGEF